MKSIRILAAIGGALLVMGVLGTAAYADENTNVQVADNFAWSEQSSAAVTGDAEAKFHSEAYSGDAKSFNISKQDQEIDQEAANQSAFVEDGGIYQVAQNGGDEMLSSNGGGWDDEDENTNVQFAHNNAYSKQASAAISGDAEASYYSDAWSGDALSFNVSEQDQDIWQDAANQSLFLED